MRDTEGLSRRERLVFGMFALIGWLVFVFFLVDIILLGANVSFDLLVYTLIALPCWIYFCLRLAFRYKIPQPTGRIED